MSLPITKAGTHLDIMKSAQGGETDHTNLVEFDRICRENESSSNCVYSEGIDNYNRNGTWDGPSISCDSCNGVCSGIVDTSDNCN